MFISKIIMKQDVLRERLGSRLQQKIYQRNSLLGRGEVSPQIYVILYLFCNYLCLCLIVFSLISIRIIIKFMKPRKLEMDL